MSGPEFNSIGPPFWSRESQAIYLACAIDTDGWVSCRKHHHPDGLTRIQASVGVTNQSQEFLERLLDITDIATPIIRNGKKGVIDGRKIQTTSDVWQIYWRGPVRVIAVLEQALPYLVAKRQRALWTLEFSQSRITPNGFVGRRGWPYTERAFELAHLVTKANGKGQL